MGGMAGSKVWFPSRGPEGLKCPPAPGPNAARPARLGALLAGRFRL